MLRVFEYSPDQPSEPGLIAAPPAELTEWILGQLAAGVQSIVDLR